MGYIVSQDDFKELEKKIEEDNDKKPGWISQIEYPYQKEKPIFENITKLVLQKLDEGAKEVYIAEAGIKSLITRITILYDELHLLGRFRICIRNTGLSVVAINDIKINDGKRTYKVYNTKLRFGVIDMEK